MATRRVPTFQTIVTPALLDRALGQIADKLQTDLSWLDRGFGLAQKLVTVDGTRPVIYEENGIDHFSLYPNENLGNFCYFERTEETSGFWEYNRYRSKFGRDLVGLVVWGNLKTIYTADWQQRTREHVRNEVMNVLTESGFSFTKSIELKQFWYEGKNIYRNHTIKEVDSQYLMRPYVGFRIDIEIIYNNENRC